MNILLLDYILDYIVNREVEPGTDYIDKRYSTQIRTTR